MKKLVLIASLFIASAAAAETLKAGYNTPEEFKRAKMEALGMRMQILNSPARDLSGVGNLSLLQTIEVRELKQRYEQRKPLGYRNPAINEAAKADLAVDQAILDKNEKALIPVCKVPTSNNIQPDTDTFIPYCSLRAGADPQDAANLGTQDDTYDPADVAKDPANPRHAHYLPYERPFFSYSKPYAERIAMRQQNKELHKKWDKQ